MTIAFWRIPVRLNILKLVRSITGSRELLAPSYGLQLPCNILSYTGPDCQLTNA